LQSKNKNDEASEFRGLAYREIESLNCWTKQLSEPVIEAELPIIDPHHHLWDDHRGRYLIAELTEDTSSGHNIIATIYIESGSMYRSDGPVAMRPVGEVEFANGIAAMSASGRYGKSRHCAGIVGYADLMLGDHVQPVLEAMIEAGNGRFRGIRYGVVSGKTTEFLRRQVPPHIVLDSTFRKGFSRLQRLGLSFESWQLYPQLPDLADLLRVFPDTNVVLNHVGGLLGISPHYSKRDEVFTIWSEQIRELAQYPNLSVKLGGLGMLFSGWDFHSRDIPPSSLELANAWRPYVEFCIDAFGVKRCMMESNFPVDKQSCGYGVLWNAMKRITQNYSESEKLELYFGVANRFYRLQL
jgi:L-fuconolactonase